MPEERCPAHAPVSPENSACAWCARYRINLDPDGRICARCQGEAAFRRMLLRQATVRFGPACNAAASYCEVFDRPVEPGLCERCQRDPETRAFLHGQLLARGEKRRREREAGCACRGPVLRTETRPCCGGKRKAVAILACALRGETHAGVCAACERWAPAAGRPGQ